MRAGVRRIGAASNGMGRRSSVGESWRRRSAASLATCAALASPAARRRPGEDAARRVLDRRNELRSAVRLGRRLGQRHLEHLRADARLRLSRAAGEARAAHARGDADRRRRRQDLHLQDPQGHLLHAGSRVQGQAARADRGGPGLRPQAAPRSGGEEPVGVAHRRQGRRQRRSAREGREDRQARLRRADCRGSRSSTATRCGSASRSPTCASSTRSPCRTRAPSRARWSRPTGSISARIRSGTGPYMLGEYKRSSKIVARRESRLSRGHLHAGGPDPARVAADRRRAQGQAAADSRRASRSASSRRARRSGSRS